MTRRHLVFKTLFVLLILLFAEGLSFFSLALFRKSHSPLVPSQAVRETIAQGKSTGLERDVLGALFLERQVLHPYLGFVTPPRGTQDLFGFDNPISPLQRRGPEHFVIAIMGGSVAGEFSNEGLAAFEEELRKVPGLAEKKIVFLKFALGGFKQPQQLMALNYMLQLGGEFDMVLNIDGFNEVALSGWENVPKNVFPLYPRSWFYRAGSYSFPAVWCAMNIGRTSLELRAKLARVFSVPFVRSSAALNLFWEVIDSCLRAAIRRVVTYLHHYSAAKMPYEVSGPTVKFGNEAEMYRYVASAWARSSILMAEICQANQIRYFHFLQPNQYVAGSKELNDEERAKAYQESNSYRPGVVTGYPLLKEEAQKSLKDVHFHDLTMIFADIRDTIYKDPYCHYNERGNDMMGREIGRIVREALSDSAGTVHASEARNAPLEDM